MEKNIKDRSYKGVSEFVNNYETKYEYGFTKSEINEILTINEIDPNKFSKALGVNTCMLIDGETIIYHCDIIKGLICTFEDREQNSMEWD